MRKGILMIGLATISDFSYLAFQKLTGTGNLLNTYLAVIFVNATALTIALIGLFISGGLNSTTLNTTNYRGIIFASLMGVSAFGIDFFTLRAYDGGVEISIAAPFIIGSSLLLASLFGIAALDEKISAIKIFGIAFVIIGCVLLVKK